ncbi:unnamed protein product [Phytophthora lilii]|uniref:Unnamed protein product n=1 Tax=Phytophthora lilii TaxID=2077276 RepID=A0A9W6UDE7_9STRA|nr:unnamed protein product [Phytophthora lilii]
MVRHGFPSAVAGDASDDFPTKKQGSLNTPVMMRLEGLMQTVAELRYPWLGWAFSYCLVLLMFFLYRCTTLKALFTMYASAKAGTPDVVIGSLILGFLEDFVCATYFSCSLRLFDSLKNIGSKWFRPASRTASARLAAEKDNATSFEVSNSEIVDAVLNVTALVFTATFFAIVRISAPWADLSTWSPTHLVLPIMQSRLLHRYCALDRSGPTHKHRQSVKVAHNDPEDGNDDDDDSSPTEDTELDPSQVLSSRSKKIKDGMGDDDESAVKTSRYVMLKISDEKENLAGESTKSTASEDVDTESDSLAKRDSIRLYECRQHCGRCVVVLIGLTEKHTLYGDDTLYRRTTGFQGDLAFDVNVSEKDPPNVLVIVVEAFRFHDSRYLVGDEDPSNLFKGANITITPNFDKWAKRGIALRNFWSSWRTSRSVESLQFAQLPYDSITKSGMTGGQRNTKLSGLPQLFSAKGYETFFTTGCLTSYDGWDAFLPSHGFNTVWSRDEMMKLAESDLGIKHGDWNGPPHRGLNWGVHDDLSFQLLGDLMVNKTKEQRQRVASGKPKKPLYLNHYTISSHVDYKQRPKWYDDAKKPDFSALYEGEEYAKNIQNYLEMRYFADVEMGKFLDRMDQAGILNDTIIVISGDHGQGPEFGNDVPEDRDVSATRVAGAIIAEGRLGNAVGMVMDDATEQYDILNTLADITGVPKGGFDQDGVGRSLKRKIKFGKRIVYSNNPTRKMSIVRGHERLRFDKLTGYMLLHNADTDHDMKNDLLPGLTQEEREEWVFWRDAGRRINDYYTKRWEGNLMFAQLPYDSVTKSGMTGGQRSIKLSGLPQLFSAKGYETLFTTGCLTDYDGWDSFLPAHGFDTVWSRNEMMKIAESELGIKPYQWRGEDHGGLDWGVHDDLSFQILGDLMVKKTKEQAERTARGQPKKPLFLNHYTISSHVDFRQRPKWYDEADKPDFSALYKGEEYADNIKNYLEMRYFADLEFGKFMDRMEAEGILNDTIIVISGDHGQGPELGNDVPEDRDVSATRVAGSIIAEGRLSDAAGLIIDDATEQYDILNTLADITGVPEGGFEQDGVGRSLKRKVKFGERIVYSNNPTRKMSIVRGHERLRYERLTDYVLLHNADTDHDMKNDLLPELSAEERANGLTGVIRDAFLTHILPSAGRRSACWSRDAESICDVSQNVFAFLHGNRINSCQGLNAAPILATPTSSRQDHTEQQGRPLLRVACPLASSVFMLQRVRHAKFWSCPWLGWLFIYACVLPICFVFRCVSLKALIINYASSKDGTPGMIVAALSLGFLEDFVCATYLACALWGFDALKDTISKLPVMRAGSVAKSWCYNSKRAGKVLTFTVSFILYITVLTPFIADLLIARTQGMRFTFELIDVAIAEKDHISAAPISVDDINQGYANAVVLLLLASFFAGVRAVAPWANLTGWAPIATLTMVLVEKGQLQTKTKGTHSSVMNGNIIEDSAVGDDEFRNSEFAWAEKSTPSDNGTEALLQGELAFDIKVTPENPPNVLLIVIESFRYHDSHYIVGDEDPSNLFKGSNITVTPNFDRWAKRGVTLRNMWSSIPTSRSLESLLFAQIPYDSAAKTGITGGRKETRLAGLPQLFKAKGYETFFTTGCSTGYDNWDVFLPSHGFDTVWNNRNFVNLAESDLKITHDQWFGSDHRGFNWGVHDDLSFQLLGDLLINKTKEQSTRVAKGDPNKPLFLNHYTISSHGPAFEPRPTWYAKSTKPDFSSLYKTEKRAGLIKNYLEMRYFTDVELGKFMDRMADEGVLNNTISVGLVIDDATEHYDILNTLADITGVPDGGFVQNGVGRSLKRKVKFGERVVYSNNPTRKMAVVRGHQRLSFDRIASSVFLHNADSDHDMTTDLFPALAQETQQEWEVWRDHGRRISSYYTTRWDEGCLLAVDCSSVK